MMQSTRIKLPLGVADWTFILLGTLVGILGVFDARRVPDVYPSARILFLFLAAFPPLLILMLFVVGNRCMSVAVFPRFRTAVATAWFWSLLYLHLALPLRWMLLKDYASGPGSAPFFQTIGEMYMGLVVVGLPASFVLDYLYGILGWQPTSYHFATLLFVLGLMQSLMVGWIIGALKGITVRTGASR